MSGETIAKTVNIFGGAFRGVCADCGLDANLVKSAVKAGVAAEGSRIAAIVGVVGTLRGTVVVLMDKNAFAAVVSTLSCGILPPDVENATSASALGELVNMICGRALVSGGFEGAEVTPPTIVVGENIKNVPATTPDMKTFTLPFETKSAAGDAAPGMSYLVLALKNM